MNYDKGKIEWTNIFINKIEWMNDFFLVDSQTEGIDDLIFK